jgi:hypothetical protein
MRPIHKKILTDDAMRPLAIQIDYADWLEIERLLNAQGAAPSASAPTTPTASQGPLGNGRWPLRGSVSRYDDPFGPAADESDWHALQ